MKQIILSCLIALIVNGGLQTRADDDLERHALKGAVYTMDNASSGNHVLSFERSADGSLSPSASDSTGGLGTGRGLGSQGAILLTGDGQWLFVCNAASPSSISSYEISEDGDIEAISSAIATKQNAACWVVLTDDTRFVYTANAGSGSISGYRVDRHGGLQLLDADGRTGMTGDGSHPIDMAFSNDGRFLYGLNSGNGTISAFRARADGSLQSTSNLSGISTAVSGLAAR